MLGTLADDAPGPAQPRDTPAEAGPRPLRTPAPLPMGCGVRLTQNMARRMSAVVAAAVMTVSGAMATPGAHADGSRLPLPAAKAFPGARYAANPTNPLAGGTWAVNNGFWENGHGVYTDYLHATGAARTYLGREALQPSALWLTGTNSFRRTKVPDLL